MDEWTDKYNPFNSMKALVHVGYWKQIVDSKAIPPPVFMSIDPFGYCNFRCGHCNASAVLRDSSGIMSRDIMDAIVATLKKWGTLCVCIGGGGEALLNPDVGYLIDILHEAGIEIGIVSNGSDISNIEHNFWKCKWIGFSMDAATSATYAQIKGVDPNFFPIVLKNLQTLTKRQIEITYKYLLLPSNCHEVYNAIKLARDMGCDVFHLRPGSYPWFNDHAVEGYTFNSESLHSVIEQVERGRIDFADQTFKVYGIVHKFTSDFRPKKSFSTCYACLTTGVFYPDGSLGVCCDRRGDKAFTLVHSGLWGSTDHLIIQKQINVSECPRCTYSHINEIFENVILKDKMMYNFI